MEEIDDPSDQVQLSCNDYFHENCLSLSIDTETDTKCPYCNADLTVEDLELIENL